jgi:hypothetical protein
MPILTPNEVMNFYKHSLLIFTEWMGNLKWINDHAFSILPLPFIICPFYLPFLQSLCFFKVIKITE